MYMQVATKAEKDCFPNPNKLPHFLFYIDFYAFIEFF